MTVGSELKKFWGAVANCQVFWDQFSAEVRNADDADAYCAAEMEIGLCLSDYGLNGNEITGLFDDALRFAGRNEEPFLCGES